MDYNLVKWPSLSQNSYTAMFKSIDGHPMEFYFHLDDNEVKKKFEQLVKACGGDFVDKYIDMTPHTAFMVDDKCVRSFYNRVSFKASYVLECVNDGVLRDINSYIHDNLSRFKVIDYMKVIYLREATFTDDKLCTLKQNVSSCSSNSDNTSKPVTQNQKVTAYSVKSTKNNFNKDENDLSKSHSKDSTQNKSGNDKSGENQCLNPCPHCVLHMDKHKNQDDSSNTSKQNSSKPQEDLRENQEPIASTSRELNCDDREHRQIKSRKVASLSVETKSKNEVEEEKSSTSDNDSEQLSPPRKANKNRRLQSSSDEDSDSPLFPSSQDIPSKSSRSVFNDNDKNVQISSEDEDDIGPPTQSHFSREVDHKHSRNPYSRKEKEAILHYIVKKEAYHTIGGVNLWKKMERSNICPQRTWMSLQNHFKRSLIKELETFPFLTKHQINLFRG